MIGMIYSSSNIFYISCIGSVQLYADPAQDLATAAWDPADLDRIPSDDRDSVLSDDLHIYRDL